MSGNLLDDDEIELGIRRHTDDKLTYKLIIANAINECRRSKNRTYKNRWQQGEGCKGFGCWPCHVIPVFG